MIFSCCAVIFALHRQAMLLSVEEDEARLLGVPFLLYLIIKPGRETR